MSEVPVPYGPKNTDGERLAAFLDGYLSLESVENIPAPEGLECDFGDMADQQKKEWFAYTYHELFGVAALEIAGLFGRSLKAWELGLISRRVVLFLQKIGMEIED